MCRVSVVIPCYNHGQYIDEAVDSILNQTFQDFKIIIVNDGSTDFYTANKLIHYKKPKTTILHKKNGHLSSARNFGIRKAESEYILTLDADDKFEPSFLEKAISVLDNNPEIGVVSCGMREFGLRDYIWYPKAKTVEDFLINNNCFASALFRKECWQEAGGYNENMKEGYEDWNFWIAIAKGGWRFHILKEVLLNYRVSKNSMISESDKKRPELIRQIVSNHREIFQKHIDHAIFEREICIQQLKNKLIELENIHKGTKLKTKLGKNRRLRVSIENINN